MRRRIYSTGVGKLADWEDMILPVLSCTSCPFAGPDVDGPQAPESRADPGDAGAMPANCAGAIPSGILDALPFYFMLVDSEHEILYANRAVAHELGVEPAEIVGAYCPKAVHGLDTPYPGCPLEEAVARHTSVERELRDSKSGTWVSTAIYKTPFRSQAGQPVYVHIIQRIDERKRAEAALRTRADTEALISTIATRFLSIQPAQVDREIARTLARVAEFLRCQRCAMYLLDEDRKDLVPTFEWPEAVSMGSAVGPPAAPTNWRQRFRTGEGNGCAPFFLEERSDEPGPDASDGAGGRHIRRSYFAPIVLGGSPAGYVRFDLLALPERDALSITRFLGVLGSVLSAAIERKRATRELVAYEQRLRSLASELVLAEERERRRLASDLHDRIGQTLALSLRDLRRLRVLSGSDEAARKALAVHARIESALADAKSLMFDLSPPVLYDLGLEPALDWLLERHQARHGLPCKLEGTGCDGRLDPDLAILLFRAVQELLTNVEKHARANSVRVNISRRAEDIVVSVEDDGVGMKTSRGFDHNRASPNGFGLFSIRERLYEHGGTIEIDSSPGMGTRVTLSVRVNGWETESWA